MYNLRKTTLRTCVIIFMIKRSIIAMFSIYGGNGKSWAEMTPEEQKSA